MEEYVSRLEYEEHNKRMDDEHRRQNHRIGFLEQAVEQNNKLLISVERLAVSMENMQKEQQEQGERLEAQGEEIKELKGRDGEMWRKVLFEVLKAVALLLVGFIFAQIGIS